MSAYSCVKLDRFINIHLLIFLTYLFLILTLGSVITNLQTFLSASTSCMLVVGW